MKRVSVVIPCFNHGKYISKAISSAREQDYEDIEVIVIDDGSNQETKDILVKLERQIDHLITQDNQGVVEARNVGIKSSTGDYILTLDADDYFASGFLKRAVKLLDNKIDVGMVTCWASIINEDGHETRISKPTGSSAIKGLFKNNASASLLFRKVCWEQVNGYDRNMNKGFEDWEFGIAIGKLGWKIEVIPEILFHYRNLPDSRNKKARIYYPEIRSYVYKKHKDLLIENMDYTLDNLLKEINSKTKEIARLKSSKSYKTDRLLKKIIMKIQSIYS